MEDRLDFSEEVVDDFIGLQLDGCVDLTPLLLGGKKQVCAELFYLINIPARQVVTVESDCRIVQGNIQKLP